MKNKDFNYFTGKKYDGMMGRCYRPNDRAYKSYGARGIKVTRSWLIDIQNFRNWIKYQLENENISEEDFVSNAKNYQLDRIDTNGHYTETNCRLVNSQTNTRNRRSSVVRIVESAEGDKINLTQ